MPINIQFHRFHLFGPAWETIQAVRKDPQLFARAAVWTQGAMEQIKEFRGWP